MIDWFQELGGHTFTPQGASYAWRPTLVWLHAISDALIALAYFSIPLTLIRFVRKRADVPYPALFIMFGAFIVACGATHALNVWTIWNGTYYLSGSVKAITAAISLATAVALIVIMPEALQLAGPEKLRRLNESLEGRVRRRTAALESANTSLREEATQRRKEITRRLNMEKKMQDAQKLESLGVLAGGIAHDFNNLLTGILGNTSVARRALSEDSAADPALDGIEQAAQRAADLCSQMLAYAGRGRFVVESLDLNAVINKTADLLRASINKTSSLKFLLADSLPRVLADASQIQQVVVNLVVNASEAMGNRPGRISISTGAVRLGLGDLAAMRGKSEIKPGEHVYLAVKDSGSGMDDRTIDRVFDPFFTTKFSGRGLGLAAVLGIVRSQKGGLQVSSKPGVGTIFRIFLPVDPTPAALPPKQAITTTDRSAFPASGVVLVIDDEEPVRSVVCRILAKMGLTAETAGNGHAGMEKFRADPGRYGLVLLDLTMPGLDGEAVFQQLQQVRPGIPVLLMSGFTAEEVTKRFAGKNIAGFVKKPFDMTMLTTAIRRVFPED